MLFALSVFINLKLRQSLPLERNIISSVDLNSLKDTSVFFVG